MGLGSATLQHAPHRTQCRNASQKHAWRAAIVLLSAGGLGTVRIMRRTQVQVLRLARTTQSPSNLVPQSHPRGGCRA